MHGGSENGRAEVQDAEHMRDEWRVPLLRCDEGKKLVAEKFREKLCWHMLVILD